MAKARVAVLISGSGTNMAALVYAAKSVDCPFEIVLVASNNPDAAGLKLAEAEGVATFSHPHKGLTREAHDQIVHEALVAAKADYVALAGYMRILSPEFVGKWEGRMLNIHPSLLPKYKGLHTHERAIEAGDSHGGCSVHLVTAELDDGPILGQTPVAILPSDTPEALAARVLIAEHQLYSRTLADFVARESSPEYLIAQVRERALALPEADEVTSHGMPCFGIIKGKKFAYVSNDHHGDGRVALLVKISGVEEQAMLIEQDADRYYRPAYFGDGWVGIRIDLGDTDWEHIGDWLGKSWRAVAPKKLSGLLDIADAF
ncbi:MAG: phosphoribosylglycinamide formyltransferase [Sphingomonadales bacterium]|jgi:phosphoribosylglycinamide formyltransferase-1|nr:phosphoribosylglycinamide formyltransferase [Sphingomonadales bacterium]MBK9003850.1 phosphoribosylglycinamide formyltransferase [Sphingomonadales bacterium]MBK9269026.1 phosphoribosylglycinamide formyltransferase [Sphingomonadales bacterium]MBP6434367.1 phosphoribosylglycinamide formyltransferase [Sphingorhabdus sp.]